MEKLIHFCWTQGFDKMPKELWGIPQQWRELNPSHQLMFWDSGNIMKLVHEHYPLLTGIFDRISKTETEKVAAVKCSDLARLLILHHHGGHYVDTDCTPFLPLGTLFEGPLVRHRFAQFDYSDPSPLSDGDAPDEKETVDWSRYELILSREHHPSAEFGGCLAANTLITAPWKGSKLLEDIISRLLPDWNNRVLQFAGPLAFSRALMASVPFHKGKAYLLPPWYMLWSAGMGKPWKHCVSAHQNILSWCDFNAPVPWDIGGTK